MKLLIWDFDGTLGYRASDHTLSCGGGSAWTAALLEVVQREMPDTRVTMGDLRTHIQSGFPWQVPDVPHPHLDSADVWWEMLEPVFARAYEGVGLGQDRARALARLVRPTYLNLSRWALFDDTVSALETLTGDGWHHVILSNHVPELSDLVEGLGLTRRFARIFNSAIMGYEKPHPQAFRLVLEAFPDAGKCWMVGDSFRADIRGAEAVGIPAVLVRRHHPDARIHAETLAEIPPMVNELVR